MIAQVKHNSVFVFKEVKNFIQNSIVIIKRIDIISNDLLVSIAACVQMRKIQIVWFELGKAFRETIGISTMRSYQMEHDKILAF